MIPTVSHAFNGLVCAGAVSLLFGVASSAQTSTYLYSGTNTITVTLQPGCYDITAYGAQGGYATLGTNNSGGTEPSSFGGLGAEMEGTFHFSAVTTLTLLVGGAGANATTNLGGGGGGGGGSFVVSGNTPLVVAGGGGGGGWYNDGGNGLIGTSGGSGGGNNFTGSGGSGGNGGGGGSVGGGGGYFWLGGGGGGFNLGVNGNGAAGANATTTGYGTGGDGGISFLNGGEGGLGGNTVIHDPGGPAADGGYGGGGGAALYGGGGGAAGDDVDNGGGGGSYLGSSASATLYATLTEISGAASPDGSTNGEIIIKEPGLQVQRPSNISAFSCTNVAVFYPNLTGSNPCCTNSAVFNPTNGSSFAPGTGTPVTWSVYDCSSTNLLSSGTFWVSVYCTNCCTYTTNYNNYNNYTVAVFPGTNYLGDWLCQGTNNTLADVLPAVPQGTEVYFWNPTLEQFITPPDTFTSGQWQNGTEPLFPGEGFLLVSPARTNLTIYGAIPDCTAGCPSFACSTTLFFAWTGLATFSIDSWNCGTLPIGTEVQEPTYGGGIVPGLSTYTFSGNWSPGTPPPLQVGYSEFIVTPPCPPKPVSVWENASSGSWSVGANWQNNLVPNGSGTLVDFSEMTLWTNFTVTLDILVTVGGLIFGDQGNLYNWTLADGGAGPLTLNNATNEPVINVENQTATITAVIAGTNGLSKSGVGTLTLAGANTYSGPTTINAGTLQLDQPSLAAGSTLTVASGGILNLNFVGTNTIAGLLLNGVSQPPGVYNTARSPGYLTGPGSLLVAPTPATNPTHIVASFSGVLLNLSWPADHTGWRLLVQTNHLASGVSANTNDWSTVSGSTSTNQVQLPMLPTQPTEFYRLVYP